MLFRSLSQIFPQLLSTNLVTVKEAPKVVNTASPKYNPNARCAYHSDSPGHTTDNCWALRNKVQDLIDAKEIQFEAPERPNVVTAPMPQHGVSAVEEDRYVASVEEIVTPLSTVKRNLLLAGLFPGCGEDCLLCVVSPFGSPGSPYFCLGQST